MIHYSENYNDDELNEIYTSSSMGAQRRGSRNERRQEPWVPRESEMEQDQNLQRRLFPSTPTISRAQNATQSQVNSMSTRKDNADSDTSGAKRLDQLHKAIFTPLRDQRSIKYSSLYSNNDETSVIPKILNLSNDEATKMEVLRSKRSIIAAGPPLLKDKPTLEEFYDWKLAITQFLEFLPGYESGILEIQPNLENLSDENLAFTIQKYELIYQILSTATISNKLVRLKTGAISRVPVRDLVTWWNTVADIFQPSDIKIKTLRDEYIACMQEENQTATEYLQDIEEKASELRKLGYIYSNSEIGNKVHEGLLPSPKLFVLTNLMSLRIPCDLQSMTKILKTYDDTTIVNVKKSLVSRNMTANIADYEDHSFEDHRLKPMYEDRFKNSSADLKKIYSVKNTPGKDAKITISENDDDEEIIRNLDIEAAVHNLRKFRKIVKQINAIKDKGDHSNDKDLRYGGKRSVAEDHLQNEVHRENNTWQNRTRSRSPLRERPTSNLRSQSRTRPSPRPSSSQGRPSSSEFNRSTYMANSSNANRPNNSNTNQVQGNPSPNNFHERSRSHSNRGNYSTNILILNIYDI